MNLCEYETVPKSNRFSSLAYINLVAWWYFINNWFVDFNPGIEHLLRYMKSTYLFVCACIVLPRPAWAVVLSSLEVFLSVLFERFVSKFDFIMRVDFCALFYTSIWFSCFVGKHTFWVELNTSIVLFMTETKNIKNYGWWKSDVSSSLLIFRVLYG